ncbi:MAG: hypothetical protein ACXWYP_03565, partial [Pseudonocardia sp.]
AFLMKGQEVPAHTRWRGNPAAETREPLVAPPAAASAPVPRPILIATLLLAALIALAVSAGVALARSMGTVVPGCGVDLAETGSTSQGRSTLRGRHALCEDAAAGVGTGGPATAARSGS